MEKMILRHVTVLNSDEDQIDALYCNDELVHSGDYYHDKINYWIAGWVSCAISMDWETRVLSIDIESNEMFNEFGLRNWPASFSKSPFASLDSEDVTETHRELMDA